MPYKLNADVNHDGVAYPRHAVVSDALGEAMRGQHRSDLTRVPHDAGDLCAAASCEHPVKVSVVPAEPTASFKISPAANAAPSQEG